MSVHYLPGPAGVDHLQVNRRVARSAEEPDPIAERERRDVEEQLVYQASGEALPGDIGARAGGDSGAGDG